MPARPMTGAELDEAGDVLWRLVAPMFDEPKEGVAFWGFYLDDRQSDLEIDEVLARFEIGRGVYAVELVWTADLELEQRGPGRVVHTLEELRALDARAQAISAGMEHTRKKLLGDTSAPIAPRTAAARGASSWLSARAQAAKK